MGELENFLHFYGNLVLATLCMDICLQSDVERDEL